ncbi:hypothetical protein SUDANB151_07262 [Streptomyces sp. enrichment culture]
MFRTAGAEPAPTSSSTLVAAVVQSGARLFDTPANLAAAERTIWGSGDVSTMPVLHAGRAAFTAAICWENYMPLFRTALYGKGMDVWCGLPARGGAGGPAEGRRGHPHRRARPR